MTRYYFDVLNGNQSTIDEEGLFLRDLDQAQVEAACSLADMARDAIRTCGMSEIHNLSVQVRDDAGPVMRAHFSFDIERPN